MGNNKNKSKNTSGNQSRGSTGGFADAFTSAGISFTPSETVKKEDNKYKNYDPNKSGKGRNSNSGGRNRNTQSNSNKNKVYQLPAAEGPHAPYNFVPFNSENTQKMTVLHDGKYSEISEEKYTGEIRYCLTAQTPILIDDGKNQFCHNKDGICVIPGSTMRGLIRSNLQILSFSDMGDDIDDYNLMYRAVAAGGLKDRYGEVLGQKTKTIDGNQMTVLENVKAGYISREGSNYYLYNNIRDSDQSFADGTADYYVISERYVLEKAKDNFKYIIDRFQNRPPFKKIVKNGKVHYIGEENKSYVPYSEPISYSLSNGRVYGIDKEGKLDKSGWVLSSGKMKEKKAFYVIPEIDIKTRRKIPKDSITAYQIDCNRKRKTIPEEARSFYELPQDGQTLPIFYIELEGKLYLGYTPRLRLMYDHTIQDGLEELKKGRDESDFAKTMLGFSTEKASRKSKVFFADAVLTNDERLAEEKNLILAEPKPTSYLEYLTQTNGKEVSTYNSNSISLRGIKQYWLHEKVTDGASSDKEKVKSALHPLKGGSSFKGKIRFQNLSKEELGLLLWSIVLEKGSQMNVGKAKAYGYGRVKVDKVDLYILNQQLAYAASLEAFQSDPYEKKSEEEMLDFICEYKLCVTGKLGKDVMQEPSIRDFFAMKSEENLMSGSTVEYMELDDFSKFNKDNNPLPTVKDICDSKNK